MDVRRATRGLTAGASYSVDLIPKTKLEVVLADAMVEKAVQAIVDDRAHRQKSAMGKFF